MSVRPFVAWALVASLGLMSTAAKADPFGLAGTPPHGLDGDTPPANNEDACFACHAGGTDDNGKLFRPTDTWAGTMMAQAARDPLYLAALTVAEQDAPGIGTLCWRCHSPQGFVKGNATPPLGSALDADDKQGVACEACHRSLDPSKTNPVLDPHGPYIGNGQLFWDPGEAKRGPYPDADSPAHATIHDPFTSSSAMCGQCHELSNPAVHLHDAEGRDTNIPFPLDTTYTEWANSAYGREGPDARGCVDCHMPAAAGTLTVSTFPSAIARENPRTHSFASSNVWGIDAVQAAEPELAVSRRMAFKSAREAAMATLAQAVKVDILSAPPSVTRGEPVPVTVRVTNLTGHKFPTGYADGRRAFLRVELISVATGRALVTIGAYDEATQTLVPHPDLHVYEAHHEQHAGGQALAWHIALSDTIAKDTRIPPKGFTPTPTTPIVGGNYGDGQGGVRPYDELTTSIPWPADHRPEDGTAFVLRATVLYQATVREFVEELVRANRTDDRGAVLQRIWNDTGKAAPIPIASAEVPITVTGDEPPSANVDGGGCGCREVLGASPASAGGAVLLGGVVALACARRRRR